MIEPSNELIEARLILIEAARMIVKRGKWKEGSRQKEVPFSTEDLGRTMSTMNPPRFLERTIAGWSVLDTIEDLR